MIKTADRKRRSADEMIAALQSKIESIKQRAERAKVKRDPSLRHISAALRSVGKATVETEDATTRKALEDVRATLSATLGINGVVVAHASVPRGRRSSAEDMSERLLAHVQKHAGHRGEEIA